MGRGSGKPASDRDNWGTWLQWCLIISNFLIFCGSVAILGVGIWTVVEKSFIDVLLRNNLFMSAAYIMIVTGCVTIILAFLGAYGAFKESKCMLLIYFVFLFLFFTVLLIGGILGYVFRHQVANTLKPEMSLTIREYDPNMPNMPITLAWDRTQSHLNCCGMAMDSARSEPWDAWKENNKINSGPADNKVPWSCCSHDAFGKATDCSTPSQVKVNEIYHDDCFVAGLTYVRDHALILAAVAIGIATTMISGMILSITLYKLID